ncbi:DUF3080 family protein [Rheinheimera salexigens]|uniref:DUF3080 domain-containing protein n=1 Tax=Rheinheimera salexigens TaxID=1628148 RepID=A0A1E7Q744_9GAMM|nr:DUF3080 family protein [Rheinheimera salexigens]OEY70012.1 hypothetical protein BI198_10870 [Rheinheimera salexigens]
MKALLLPLLLISVVACSDNSGEQALKDYQQRIERVLNLDAESTGLKPVQPLIAIRDLKQTPTDIRLDLSDAYATRQCGLDQLIGERNSSLGRLYSPSKLLHYELRLLSALENCLSQSWQDTALQQTLQDAYKAKQADINVSVQNMLLTDSALRKELIGTAKTLPLQAAGFTETWQALTTLNQLTDYIADKNWAAASDINIEQQLQQLYHYNFIGRLQYSLRISAHQLQQINNLLQPISADSLCANQRETEQLSILSNVFQKYYIAKIQPYIGQLNDYQQQLMPLINNLYNDSPITPMLEQRFVASHLQMRQQLTQHVTWWQQLNNSCPIKLQATEN